MRCEAGHSYDQMLEHERRASYAMRLKLESIHPNVCPIDGTPVLYGIEDMQSISDGPATIGALEALEARVLKLETSIRVLAEHHHGSDI